MASGPNPPTIQAHICVKEGRAASAFYENAFGAVCSYLQMADDGQRAMHSNIELFGGEVMLHDESPDYGGDVLLPLTRGGAGMPIQFNLANPADVDRPSCAPYLLAPKSPGRPKANSGAPAKAATPLGCMGVQRPFEEVNPS